MPLRFLNKYLKDSSWARTFLVTLVFLVLASSLFWLDYFRAYQTEVSVLFVTEENQPAPVVADAMGAIMRTLTFALRAENDFSPAALLPETDSKDLQKSTWNKNLHVVTKQDSGVLLFSQQGSSEVESREKATATLKTLMLATNLYYDKEHEVELRIIDKPVTKLVVSNKVGYALTVLATATMFTSIFFAGLALVTRRKPSGNGKMGIENHIGESVSWIDPQKFVAVRPEKLGFQEPVVQEKASPVVEALTSTPVVTTKTAQKVAHAPGNLPIMAGALPQFGIEEVDLVSEETFPDIGEESIEKPVTSVDVTAEPTVEEYKRRLNELLKGKSI
jgi:hypothetical protein